MRELALVDTVYVGALLLLSLVLPLLMSFRMPEPYASRRSPMRTVWAGQVFLLLVGLAVLASARLAPYAAVCGLICCVGCMFLLVRHLRALEARRARPPVE